MAEPEGIRTPIAPSLVQRIVQGVRYVVSGDAPSAWFGPNEPLQPTAQQAAGRQFDYPAGYNIWYTPRSEEAVSFGQLRALADGYDILRLAIETRKDQMAKLRWTIKPKTADRGQAKRLAEEYAEQIKQATDFFCSPDRAHSWDEWLRMLLEEVFVTDAPALYVNRTKGGQLYALEPLDGALLKRVITAEGRTPLPPAPAYQQVLKGAPAVNYSSDQIIYRPRNPRVWKAYGLSPTEQCVTIVNIAIRRQLHQLSYYVEGNTPDLLFRCPQEWNPDQIKQFQVYWDSLMAGNSAERRRAKFVPHGVDPIDTKAQALKDEADEWIARVICYCFSLPPTAFVKQTNRATAQAQQDAAIEEGLLPLQLWVRGLCNYAIWHHMGLANLEFSWQSDPEPDPLKRMQINCGYVATGVLLRDEVRDEEFGREPLPDGEGALPPAWPGTMPPGEGGLEGGSTPPAPGKQDPDDPEAGGDDAGKCAHCGRLAKLARPKPPGGGKRLPPIPFDDEPVGKLSKHVKRFLGEQADNIVSGVKQAGEDVIDPEAVAGKVLAESVTEAMRTRLLGATEDYLEETFGAVGGKALAAVDVTDKGILEVVDEKAIAYAGDRAAEIVGMKRVGDELVPNLDARWAITDTTRDMIHDLVVEQLQTGADPGQFEKDLREHAAFNENRADMVARTELARAHGEGAIEGYRQAAEQGIVVKKEWLLSGNGDNCDICQENADAGPIDLDEAFPSGDDAPPGHPNCLPGDSHVLAEGVTAASKRWYDGDLVVIRTASGKNLACTPNHPVLTPSGWIPARLLDVGNHVISRCLGQGEAAGLNLEDEDVPARIEDIAEAFGRSEHVTATPMPTTSEDFHGDGAGSEVAVIWANGLLRDNFKATGIKHSSKAALDLGDVQAPLHHGLGVGDLGAERDRAATNRSVGGGALECPLFRGHPGILDGLSFRVAPWDDARLSKASPDSAPINAVLEAEGEFRGPREVKLLEFLNGQVKPSTSKGDSRLLDTAINRVNGDAHVRSDGRNIFSCLIAPDAVVHKKVVSFSGHVYNLQTDSALYIAEGIVTHNCECDVIASVIKDNREDAAGYEEADEDLEAAAKPGGLRKFDPDQARDETGKWSPDGGGEGEGASEAGEGWLTGDSAREAAAERGLTIPPAWTNVRVAEDPKAERQVLGKDAKGREQPIYTAEHWEKSAAEKFERGRAFLGDMEGLNEQISKDAAEGKQEAQVMQIIAATGLRIGSTTDTGAEKQAYGASTLLASHVSVDGESVRFEFTGKKGVEQDISVMDKDLASMVQSRLEGKDGDERIFSVSADSVRNYVNNISGDKYSPKDWRTNMGTTTAKEAVEKYDKPITTDREYRQAVNSVCKEVSAKLGNTPAVAKASYIAPHVWSRLQERMTEVET